MLEQDTRYSIHIQKKDEEGGGRLHLSSIALLRDMGFTFASNGSYSRLSSLVKEYPWWTVYFDRVHDIPPIVARGTTDIGIVGQNTIEEYNLRGFKVIELVKTGYGNCSLVLASHEGIKDLNDLNTPTDSKRGKVVTDHLFVAQRFLKSKGVSDQIENRSGSLESYVGPDKEFDAMVGIVETGNTLGSYGLRTLEVILSSEAVVIASPRLREVEGSERIIRNFLERLVAVLRARESTLLLINVPRSAQELVVKALPSTKSPTIVGPLADHEWEEMQSVVPKKGLDEVISYLHQLGVLDIVKRDIDWLIPNPGDPEIEQMMTKIYGPNI